MLDFLLGADRPFKRCYACRRLLRPGSVKKTWALQKSACVCGSVWAFDRTRLWPWEFLFAMMRII